MRNYRFLLASMIFTCLSFTFAKTSVAGVIKYPENDPTFTIEVPTSWTCKPDKNGDLDCNIGNDEGFSFHIMNVKSIHTGKEMKALLPKLVNSMAEEMKLKNFAVGDIETDKNGNDVSFMGLAGDGKLEGVEFSVMAHAFEPQKGKFYAIILIATKASDKKHEKEYDNITASIAPID